MKVVPAIYAVRMNGNSVPEELERMDRWSALVPAERAARLARLRHWEDRWRSLAGDMLVRYALQERYGLPVQRIAFTRNAYGKPELRENDVQFNVSHAGEMVVAAFHSAAVGIDIERIGRADMELARTMFTAAEYEALRSLPAYERDRLFYAIWTGKESCMKAAGVGLAIPLDSFCVADIVGSDGRSATPVRWLRSDRAADGSEAAAQRWQVRHYELDPAYMLAVCTTATDWPARVTVLDASQLIVSDCC